MGLFGKNAESMKGKVSKPMETYFIGIFKIMFFNHLSFSYKSSQGVE